MRQKSKLVRVGYLARQVGMQPSKIRYYVNQGLLLPVDRTTGGQYLFDESECIERLGLIRQFKEHERLTLEEIKEKLPPRRPWDHGSSDQRGARLIQDPQMQEQSS